LGRLANCGTPFDQPGYINTPTNAGVVAGPEMVAEQEKRIAMGRFGTAGEVADVVAFLFR